VLLITLVSTPIIILMARLLALNLPFRLRPIHNEELNFTLPTGVLEKSLDGWSSFPSDHAVLYFAIAIGVFAASRRIGLLSIFYTLVFIGLPRIYTGYHYPTDILGGFAIGGCLMWASIYFLANSPIPIRINSWSEKYAGAFYALFFVLTYQIANLFVQSRDIVTLLFQ
jgi:undecaprenyl-diphosphatase